jgi:hypothetical protein
VYDTVINRLRSGKGANCRSPVTGSRRVEDPRISSGPFDRSNRIKADQHPPRLRGLLRNSAATAPSRARLGLPSRYGLIQRCLSKSISSPGCRSRRPQSNRPRRRSSTLSRPVDIPPCNAETPRLIPRRDFVPRPLSEGFGELSQIRREVMKRRQLECWS